MSKINNYKNKMYNLADITKNTTNSILDVYNIMEQDKKTYFEAVEQYCKEMKASILNNSDYKLELLLILLANNSDNTNKCEITNLVIKIIKEDTLSLQRLMNDDILLVIYTIKEIEENDSKLSYELINLLKTKKFKKEILDELTVVEKESVIDMLGTEVFIDEEINDLIKNILINKKEVNTNEDDINKEIIISNICEGMMYNLKLYDITKNECSILSLLDENIAPSYLHESKIILYIRSIVANNNEPDIDIEDFRILLSNLSILLSDEELRVIFNYIFSIINPKRYELEMKLLLLGNHKFHNYYDIYFNDNYNNYRIVHKYTNNKSFINFYNSTLTILKRIKYWLRFKLD